MKRTGLIGFFLLTLATVETAAEPIVVRSGEHDSFTRIVLPLPINSKWRLETEPGLGTLVIDDFNDGFDLSEAFEIIPRTRLAALLSQPSELQMQLTCDCSIEAFVEQNNFLVIDIGNGPPLGQTESAQVISSPLPTSDFSYGQLLWSSNQASNSLFDGRAETESTQPEATPESFVEQFAIENQIRETQSELLEAFSTAVAKDLLDLREAPQTQFARESEPTVKTEIYDSSSEEVVVAPDSLSNIRVTNSKDIPGRAIQETLDMAGARCVDADIVAIQEWGSKTRSFGEQISASLEKIFDSFGRIDKDSVVKHARLYLYFGFGAEAKKALTLAPDAKVDNPELIDLANIFEFGFAKNPRLLHRFAQCDSALALWGILAANEVPQNVAINTNAALQALQELPTHLRHHVAQSLSERFLQRGDVSSAAVAMRIYENLLENKPKVPNLAQAQLSKMRGDLQSSAEVLNGIVSENTSEAPKAFFAIIDNHVSENKPVSTDMALLAETYAFEHRQSEFGPIAYRSFVQATAKSGQLAKAFSSMRAPSADLVTDYENELSNFLISEATNITAEHEFLTLYFEYFEAWSGRLSPAVILNVAQRLNALGFFETAENALQILPSSFQSEERRILEAKLHTRAERYSRALEILTELDGTEVFVLKGEIYERIGENETAASYFDAANLPERSVANMWLADGWAELIEEDEPVFGSLVRLSNEEKSDIKTDEEMLANSERAVQSSAGARASIEASLNALTSSAE